MRHTNVWYNSKLMPSDVLWNWFFVEGGDNKRLNVTHKFREVKSICCALLNLKISFLFILFLIDVIQLCLPIKEFFSKILNIVCLFKRTIFIETTTEIKLPSPKRWNEKRTRKEHKRNGKRKEKKKKEQKRKKVRMLVN